MPVNWANVLRQSAQATPRPVSWSNNLASRAQGSTSTPNWARNVANELQQRGQQARAAVSNVFPVRAAQPANLFQNLVRAVQTRTGTNAPGMQRYQPTQFGRQATVTPFRLFGNQAGTQRTGTGQPFYNLGSALRREVTQEEGNAGTNPGWGMLGQAVRGLGDQMSAGYQNAYGSGGGGSGSGSAGGGIPDWYQSLLGMMTWKGM